MSVAVGAVVLALGAMVFAPAAEATRTTLRIDAGLSTNYDFARLVLEDGGWPTSANNTTVLTQWLRAEEPTSMWWNRDNPLNNGLGSGGGSGLGSYGSVVVAAFDVASNLENPAYGYPLVVRDLAASAAPASTSRAIWRSNWSAGHYGRGADWDTSPVPSVGAPARVWRDPAACPTEYPPGEVGPCGRGFSTSGSSWRSGAPGGVMGQELWALSTGSRSDGSATWRPAVAPGEYAISAFVPATFADAVAAYVVRDATGGHRVLLNLEPYRNAWAALGDFQSSASAPLVVTLGTSSRSSDDGTYVAADALRFTRVASTSARSRQPARLIHPFQQRPGPAQNVAALAADGSALVSWLAPSKDGTSPVVAYTATALPGGRSCQVAAPEAGQPTCTVQGLADGHTYVFVVRAVSRAGVSNRSAPSSVVRPLHTSVLTLITRPTPVFGKRVVYRAVVSPTPASGVVLFAMDGRVLPGCQNARVVSGHASCATRLVVAGRHDVLATYSGSESSSGAEAATSLLVARATTTLRASSSPRAEPLHGLVTLRAWGLPNPASGKIVFVSGASHLCVVGVRSGAGACTFRLRLSVGLHGVIAEYLGNRDFTRATARTTLLVLAASSSSARRHPDGRS
jgi:hypothetical protein